MYNVDLENSHLFYLFLIFSGILLVVIHQGEEIWIAKVN